MTDAAHPGDIVRCKRCGFRPATSPYGCVTCARIIESRTPGFVAINPEERAYLREIRDAEQRETAAIAERLKFEDRLRELLTVSANGA